MKFLLTTLVVFTTLFGIYAQDLTPAQVPEAVTGALKKTYPQAGEVKWKLKKDLYKADFKIGKTDHELWLDKAGAVEKHTFEIKDDGLPANVMATIGRDYKTYTIGKCEQTDEKGVSTYKVNLKSDAGKKHVRFGADGKVILKEE